MRRNPIFKLLPLLALLVLAVAFWPAPAHAGSLNFLDFFDPIKAILRLVIYSMEGIHGLLAYIVQGLGIVLTGVVSNPQTNSGGAAVYVVWKILRDICNSVFIVFFILIAFSTIFNSLWKGSNPFYYRSALMNVVLAAILINFSLPIGQTIIWGGNQAATMVAKLMSGQNIGAQLATQLKVADRIAAVPAIAPTSVIPDENTPLDQQGPVQRITSQNFTGEAKETYDECVELNLSDEPNGCFAMAARVNAEKNATAIDEGLKPGGTFAGLKDWASFVWNWNAQVAKGAAAAITSAYKSVAAILETSTYQELFLKLISISINNLLLMMMIVSFMCVIVWMGWRIPMLWFLLASSSVAFFSIAIPGSKRFGTWLGDIIGYSIFGPLYLFAIYIGMFVLSQQNSLLTGLNNAAFFDGVYGVFLFYFMAAGIFIGGARISWQMAFAWSEKLKNSVTSKADFLGVGEKSNFGFNTLAQRTGMTARYEGAKAGIKGRWEESVTKPQQKREQDITRKWQAGFGDKKTREALDRKTISEQMAKNKELGLSTSGLEADMKKALKSNDQTGYLAAAKELLDRGELPLNQMEAYVKAANNVSPSFGASAREAVNKSLREKAKEKKYKDKSEVLAALKATAPDGKESFLRDLKKNDVLAYAQLAMESEAEEDVRKFEKATVRVLPEDILRNNLSKIDAESIVKAQMLARDNGWPIDADLNLRFEDLASEKGNYYKIIDGAKDPNARAAAITDITDLKNAKEKTDLDKARKIAEAGAEANAEALMTAQERLEATREERARNLAARAPGDYSI